MVKSAECRVPSAEWWSWRSLALLIPSAFLFAAASACGDGGEDIDIIPPAGSPTAAATTEVSADPTPDPTEFRVAYINLMSPRSLDATNTVPAETFERRIAIVVEQLKAFKPDLVAFSEVSSTEIGRAKDILVRELKMEPLYVRAKPWYSGQSKEEGEQFVKAAKFEEGELILVNGSRFIPQDGEPKWMNPRTADGEAAAGLWWRLKGPGSIGDIDIFVTHLTGTDPRVRAQQSADFAQFVASKRGNGPTIVLGDLGDAPGSGSLQALLDLGLKDAFEGLPVVTCCRESVKGEQPSPILRTDFILVSGWAPSVVDVFADEPKKLADGELLYASDHNGVAAIFPIAASGR